MLRKESNSRFKQRLNLKNYFSSHSFQIAIHKECYPNYSFNLDNSNKYTYVLELYNSSGFQNDIINKQG